MRRISVVFIIFCLLAGAAYAQRFDIAVGAGTVKAAKSSGSLEDGTFVQTLGSGTFLNFSGTLLIHKNLGFNGEVAWRAKQDLYGGYQPFRPIFFDFNGIYAPNLAPRVGVDLMAGIGAETARFYTPQFTCGFTGCTNYISQTHFMVHFGGGVRLYVKGNFFVRPEVHAYLIPGNKKTSTENLPFSSNYATRFGISLGYSLGAQED